jgi:urease accessory protein
MATDPPDARGRERSGASDTVDYEPPDPAPTPPPEATNAPHPAFEAYATESVPQAAVGAPGKDGTLELTFAAGATGTDLVYDYATSPFHVSGTLGHDPHPDGTTVIVQSPTGGVAQGDRREVDVVVEPGAVAGVSTQGSTRVQSMTHNYAAADAALSVGSGGHLDYVPEPTILHADARYHRELTLSVAADATAVLGDVLVPGRLARGERFEFERYVSEVRIEGPEGRLFADATHLDPAESDPTAPGVLGEFPVHGTLFVVAPGAETAGLSDAIHGVVAGAPARGGATALPNDAGVGVRTLGDRAETVTATLRAAWDHARRELLDAGVPAGRTY